MLRGLPNHPGGGMAGRTGPAPARQRLLLSKFSAVRRITSRREFPWCSRPPVPIVMGSSVDTPVHDLGRAGGGDQRASGHELDLMRADARRAFTISAGHA